MRLRVEKFPLAKQKKQVSFRHVHSLGRSPMEGAAIT